MISVTVDQRTLQDPLVAFDAYLVASAACARQRGATTSGMCGRSCRPCSWVLLRRVEIGPHDVVEFIREPTRRYQARTVELAASTLRSFFGSLQVEGLCGDQLVNAVPMMSPRRTGLLRHLPPGQFEQLITSLDASSPRGVRDRATLCASRG